MFADKHKNWPKKDIAQLFKEEGVPKSTVYQILQRKENKKPPERKNRMTPPHCKMTREKVKRLKTKIDHKSGFSQRALAKTFGVSQSTIHQKIKYKTRIKYRKKVRAPKRTPKQKIDACPKCYHPTKLFRGKKVIIDDES